MSGLLCTLLCPGWPCPWLLRWCPWGPRDMFPFIIGLPARLPAGDAVKLFGPFVLMFGVPGAFIVFGVFAPEPLPLRLPFVLTWPLALSGEPLLEAVGSFAAGRCALPVPLGWTRLHSAPPSERRWRCSFGNYSLGRPRCFYVFDF